jgi:hypothetical protein
MPYAASHQHKPVSNGNLTLFEAAVFKWGTVVITLLGLGGLLYDHVALSGSGFALRPWSWMDEWSVVVAIPYMLGVVVGPNFWRGILWGARASIAYSLLALWVIRAEISLNDLKDWHFIVGLALWFATQFLVHWIAQRNVLGWIIDERGERQRVEFWNRGVAVYSPTTRDERLVNEAVAKTERRRTLALSLLFAAPLGCWAYLNLHSKDAVWAIGAGLLAGAVFLVQGAPALVREALYQLEFQDMAGAKVLDAKPERTSLRDVAAQKAHGDAKVATEDEAVSILSTGR